MKQVEFRLLQLVISHVSGDKQTLALLHWDGMTLRVADSVGPLPVVDPIHRDAVRATALEWIRRARRTASSLDTSAEPRARKLADVFPVRAGLGAALLWTPVTTFQAGDAAAHFDALVHEMRLDCDSLVATCPPEPACSPCMSVATSAYGAPPMMASCRG